MLTGFKFFTSVNEDIRFYTNLNNCLYGSEYLLEDDRSEFEAGRKKAPWRSRARDFFSKNPKTNKSDLVSQEGKMSKLPGINRHVMNRTLGNANGYESFVVHLTPAAQSGFVTCPCASGGCKSTCLQTSGNIGALADKTSARLKKTWFLAKEMPHVISNMAKFLYGLRDRVTERGNKLVVRLNGTSDLHWENMRDEDGRTLMERFPDIMFYDYTKVAPRVGTTPDNYHLTFSRSENNDAQALQMLQQGHNVAVVFGPGKTHNKETLTYPDGRPLLPAVWNGFKVINGDKHDLRFLEKQPKGKPGLVIGLIAKGASAFESYSTKDNKFLGASGFVVQPNDPSITNYEENSAFIQRANELIDKRNSSKKNMAGRYAQTKAMYQDEQRVIAGLLSGDLSDYEKMQLAKSPHYRRLIGKFDEIEAYCRKYPSMCSGDYLKAAGKSALAPYTDVAGEKTPTPVPFDLDKLKSMGVIAGKKPQPADDVAKEKEFQAWLAARDKPRKFTLL